MEKCLLSVVECRIPLKLQEKICEIEIEAASNEDKMS